ncbi:MAG: hypothetical protein N4A45_07840 [Flavobacteriales bacterium]|jgi:predicted transcriptional regulator|nr:hypothetical protein [Flavobacteriales bacterium]
MAKNNILFENQDKERLRLSDEHLLVEVFGGVHLDNLDSLSVTLKISKKKSRVPAIRTSIDLYRADSVDLLLTNLCQRFEIGFSDTQNFFAEITNILEEYRFSEIRNKQSFISQKGLSLPIQKKTEKILNQKNLTELIQKELTKAGICANQDEALLIYLSVASRKMPKPLSICFLDNGQLSQLLFEKMQYCLPSSETLFPSSISSQALFYFSRDELHQKALFLSNIGTKEELHTQLNELIRKGRLQKVVSLKNHKTGIPFVMSPEINGPVALCASSKKKYAHKINALPFLSYPLHEDEEELNAWHEQEKRMFAGLIDSDKQMETQELLKTIQLSLEEFSVINPYALDIFLPKHLENNRKLLYQLLQLSSTITFIHQKNRVNENGVLQTQLSDLEIALNLFRPLLEKKNKLIESSALERFYEWLKEFSHQREYFKIFELLQENPELRRRNVNRYLKELMEVGLLEIKGGKKQTGYQYALLDYHPKNPKPLQETFEEYKNRLVNKLSQKEETAKQ